MDRLDIFIWTGSGLWTDYLDHREPWFACFLSVGGGVLVFHFGRMDGWMAHCCYLELSCSALWGVKVGLARCFDCIRNLEGI